MNVRIQAQLVAAIGIVACNVSITNIANEIFKMVFTYLQLVFYLTQFNPVYNKRCILSHAYTLDMYSYVIFLIYKKYKF